MSYIKLIWIFYFILILFFRYSYQGKIAILIYSILLALITIVNSIKSRNEWREVAEEYHEGKEK